MVEAENHGRAECGRDRELAESAMRRLGESHATMDSGSDVSEHVGEAQAEVEGEQRDHRAQDDETLEDDEDGALRLAWCSAPAGRCRAVSRAKREAASPEQGDRPEREVREASG